MHFTSGGIQRLARLLWKMSGLVWVILGLKFLVIIHREYLRFLNLRRYRAACGFEGGLKSTFGYDSGRVEILDRECLGGGSDDDIAMRFTVYMRLPFRPEVFVNFAKVLAFF
jgi:hypothetical protein